MPVVDFVPLGVKVLCDEGMTIFEVARKSSIPIAESCGGDKICGHCRIEIVQGIENLSEPDLEELKLMKEKNFLACERLACAVRIYGNVKIKTSYW